jgi:hemin uptake protein HemP
MSQTDGKAAASQSTKVRPAGAIPRIDAATLLGDSKEIRILHHGTEYRLRVTQQGKLLLTK